MGCRGEELTVQMCHQSQTLHWRTEQFFAWNVAYIGKPSKRRQKHETPVLWPSARTSNSIEQSLRMLTLLATSAPEVTGICTTLPSLTNCASSPKPPWCSYVCHIMGVKTCRKLWGLHSLSRAFKGRYTKGPPLPPAWDPPLAHWWGMLKLTKTLWMQNIPMLPWSGLGLQSQ